MRLTNDEGKLRRLKAIQPRRRLRFIAADRALVRAQLLIKGPGIKSGAPLAALIHQHVGPMATILPGRGQIKRTEKGAAVHLLAARPSRLIGESLRAISGSGLGSQPQNNLGRHKAP